MSPERGVADRGDGGRPTISSSMSCGCHGSCSGRSVGAGARYRRGARAERSHAIRSPARTSSASGTAPRPRPCWRWPPARHFPGLRCRSSPSRAVSRAAALVYVLAWRRGMHAEPVRTDRGRYRRRALGRRPALSDRHSDRCRRAAQAVAHREPQRAGLGAGDAAGLGAGGCVCRPWCGRGGRCGRWVRRRHGAALGVRVQRTRLGLTVLGVVLAATATGAAGPIGFVALTAPQLARRLTRQA